MAFAKDGFVVVWFVFWVGWLLHGTRLALLRVGSWQGLFRSSLERERFLILVLAEEVGLASLSARSKWGEVKGLRYWERTGGLEKRLGKCLRWKREWISFRSVFGRGKSEGRVVRRTLKKR